MAQARAENELLKKALALIEAKKAELKAIESELKARVSAIEITRLKEEKLLSDMAASRKKFGDFFFGSSS